MAKIASAVVSIIVTVLIDFSNGDYCNIPTCNPSNSQTLCIYQSLSEKCQRGNLGGGLSENQQHEIVNRHNQWRRKVASGQETRGRPGPQPAAKSMPNLIWDTELAKVAQRWADQCHFGHDKCRNVDRFKVGQNIAYRSTTGPIDKITYTQLVDDWYNEVAIYNSNDVSKFSSTKANNGEDIGHYTQMVWAKTMKIGCGARKYLDGRSKVVYLVCNYGPGGNVLGQPLYETR